MCYRLITLLLLCVLVFAGCLSEDPAPEPSPAALARSVQAEEDSALYLGLIRRLDFLLEGEDWQSPEEIDKVSAALDSHPGGRRGISGDAAALCQ